MTEKNSEYYNDQEHEKLFKLIERLAERVDKNDIELKSQVTEIYIEVKRYNNMRERFDLTTKKLEELEKASNRNGLLINTITSKLEGEGVYREKIAWGIALLTSLITILTLTGLLN